jgi:hypothetical protein
MILTNQFELIPILNEREFQPWRSSQPPPPKNRRSAFDSASANLALGHTRVFWPDEFSEEMSTSSSTQGELCEFLVVSGQALVSKGVVLSITVANQFR